MEDIATYLRRVVPWERERMVDMRTRIAREMRDLAETLTRCAEQAETAPFIEPVAIMPMIASQVQLIAEDMLTFTEHQARLETAEIALQGAGGVPA